MQKYMHYNFPLIYGKNCFFNAFFLIFEKIILKHTYTDYTTSLDHIMCMCCYIFFL